MSGLERENALLRERVAELERTAAVNSDAARFLQSLLEVVPAFIARIDSNLRIQYLNAYQVGFTPEEVVGRSILDFVDPADRERSRALLERTRTTGEIGAYDTHGVGANGQPAVYHNRATALPGADGRTGLCVASVELTVLHQREAALRETEAKLRVALEATGLGLWSWDALSGSMVWDETMRRLHGRDVPVSLADYIEQIVYPQDRSKVALLSRRILEAARFQPIAYRIVRADGQLRWVLSSGNLVTDEQGTVLKMMGGTLDITENRAIEDQLRQAQKMEAIGSLTAGIVHNFNNMLAVIMPALELVSPFVPQEHQALSRDASHASQRASELVRQLMSFARHSPREGRATHDLFEIVDVAVGICRRAFDQRLLVYAIYEGPPASTFCNAGQIEQVLINLLLNARDAAAEAGRERGRVTVRVTTQGQSLPPLDGQSVERPCARVEICDDGPGMNAEAQARAFEPFFTTKAPGRGTGLGLTTSRAIIRDHDGTLECRSEPGAGATFTVSLPLSTEPTQQPAVTVHDPLPAQVSVLLVDNEAAVRSAVGQVLVDSGLRVFTAASGAEACTRLIQNPQTDIVLLDRSMPDGPGEHFVPRLRELAPDARIVFFSGEVLDADVLALADGVVNKPVHGRALVEAIAQLLAGNLRQ